MALTSGARLGPYEILAPLGQGGMGEVYRARDTQLDRDVAIKVLPDLVAQDPERIARFRREAKTLAALNHPNIAIIHGLEESGGVHALVMELVDGPTLAERITQGLIPIDETVPIAKQIVEALEAAHEQGVIHRDLKPANIKVREDGTVKVLDFGLAKLTQAPGSGPQAPGELSQSPTISSPAMMTGVGVILGTAAYMAPEQAKGREADKRSDVWAFGAVLFEMLTGTRAFDGEDMSDTLASVLKSDPDWTRLPGDVPQALRTLMQRCLAKDRRQRVSEIAAAKFVLSELSNISATQATTVTSAPVVVPRSPWQVVLPAMGAAALTAVIVGAWALRPTPSPPVVAQFSFTLPEGQAFSGTNRQNVAISRDGTRLAYVANSRLYLRSIGELEAHAVPGAETTRGAASLNSPMFAPDGESIAFWETAAGGLKRIPIGGGTASMMANMAGGPQLCGATWGPDGVLIAFGGSRGQGGIWRVSPNAGVPERIIGVGADEDACGPQMLPGGHTVLFTLAKNTDERDDRWDKAQIVVQSLADGTRRVLIEGGSDARYLPTGHLLYAVAGTMLAVPFDVGSLTVTGKAVPVIRGVRRSIPGQPNSATQVAVSETGTLMYVPGPATTSSTLFSLLLGDDRGDPVRLEVPRAEYVQPRVSPNGGVLAVGRNDGRDSDIWTYDLSGKTELRRLTFGGNNRFPVWSHDSRRVTFQSGREGDRAIFWQPADGGTAERLTKPADGEEHVPESWSRDGRYLLFSVAKGGTSSLRVFTLGGRKTEPFGAAPSFVSSASFSSDGRWVVYRFRDGRDDLSSNSGVFVEPFPATGEKHQAPKIRRDYEPAWAPDSKSIFYTPELGELVSVPITTRPAVTFGTPVELTRAPRPGLQSGHPRGYDVLPDGRFVSVSAAFDDGPSAAATGGIRVVLNWHEELKRLVPSN